MFVGFAIPNATTGAPVMNMRRSTVANLVMILCSGRDYLNTTDEIVRAYYLWLESVVPVGRWVVYLDPSCKKDFRNNFFRS